MVKWVSQMMTTKSAGVQAMGKDTGVAIFMATWSALERVHFGAQFFDISTSSQRFDVGA